MEMSKIVGQASTVLAADELATTAVRTKARTKRTMCVNKM
jgi:hypothetical protein